MHSNDAKQKDVKQRHVMCGEGWIWKNRKSVGNYDLPSERCCCPELLSQVGTAASSGCAAK